MSERLFMKFSSNLQVSFSMPFLCQPIDAIIRNILCRNDLPGKKRFFRFLNFLLLSFLCTAIETVISNVLCENENLRIYFFQISRFIFSCFPCVSPLKRFLLLFSVKTVFHKKHVTFHISLFFVAFRCTIIQTSFRIASCQKKENSFFSIFKFNVVKFFLCKPIDAIFRILSIKKGLSLKRKDFLIFHILFFIIFPVYNH